MLEKLLCLLLGVNMACQSCQKKVSNSDRIVCQGFCGASFHHVCVNVDEPLREQLGLCGGNVFWMCNGCAELFSNMHFRSMMSSFDEKTITLPTAIQSMQADIEKLHSAVQTLSEKVDAKPNPPTPFPTPNPWPIPRSNVNVYTPKRFRNSNGNPVNVFNGSNQTGTKSVIGIKTVRLERDQEDDLTWIYLSAFHPSTSESQIASLVSECLNMPENMSPKAIKLVPKGRDLNTLDFVSFKIGIHARFKEQALSCESWPENIRFRVFEDNRAKNGPKIVSLSSVPPHPENNPHSSMETSESSNVV